MCSWAWKPRGGDFLPAHQQRSADLQWQRLGYLLIASTLVANLIYIASGRIELCEDEAYQWLWSRHPAWGYYSKPPLIAWMQFVGTHLWGENELGVRFFSPVCAAVVGWVLLRFLSREVNGRVAFLTLLVATATPLLAGTGLLFIPDSLAILFWTAALVSGWHALRGDSIRAWLLTGLWMGLGLLSKQVALYQWLCWLVFFCLYPPARHHLRRAGFYFALLITLLGALPLVCWNIQNGWATAIHLQGRSGLADSWHPTLRFFGEFVGAEMGLLTPIFCIGIVLAAYQILAAQAKLSARALPLSACPCHCSWDVFCFPCAPACSRIGSHPRCCRRSL